jgi:hypothetical protein
MGVVMLQSANHHAVDLRFVSPSQKREEKKNRAFLVLKLYYQIFVDKQTNK